MNELETAIHGKLAAGTALTTLLGGTAVYNGTVPQGAVYPCVVFSQVSEVDGYTLAAQATADLIYQVKAITKNPVASPSRKLAGEIDAAVKALLNDASLTISGKTLLSIRRRSGFAFDEVDSGLIYTHKGADYRVWTTP